MERSFFLSLEEIRLLPPEEAITELDKFLSFNPEDEEAFTLRGLRHWALNHRQLAINDYHAAISINPNSKACLALKMANQILDYYNKDLLNP